LDLINRYIAEVLPKKKVCLNETIILKAFMRQEFVNKSITKVSSEDFAKYRDKRLENVKPATILRELCIVQNLYSLANKEWGLNISNPVKKIQKPKFKNKIHNGEYELKFYEPKKNILEDAILITNDKKYSDAFYNLNLKSYANKCTSLDEMFDYSD